MCAVGMYWPAGTLTSFPLLHTKEMFFMAQPVFGLMLSKTDKLKAFLMKHKSNAMWQYYYYRLGLSCNPKL